jgi:hypothetical protein
MIELLKLLPKSLTIFLYAVAALLRFYGNSDTILFSFFPFTTIEGRFLGSGSLVANLGLEWHAGNQSRMKTLQQEHELRMKTLQQENERLDGIILQTRKENDQLAILESKIDGLFSKYNINSKVHQTPEQP